MALKVEESEQLAPTDVSTVSAQGTVYRNAPFWVVPGSF
jgi:hypothetical protein